MRGEEWGGGREGRGGGGGGGAFPFSMSATNWLTILCASRRSGEAFSLGGLENQEPLFCRLEVLGSLLDPTRSLRLSKSIGEFRDLHDLPAPRRS